MYIKTRLYIDINKYKNVTYYIAVIYLGITIFIMLNLSNTIPNVLNIEFLVI